MTNPNHQLRVFLCHASSDKPAVRNLYERLVNDGIDAWLDKEKLIPGQNWQIEIPKAVKNSDAVIVCLSSQSVTKEGFVQKEIRFALDAADEKPEGTIFIIPARLENCNVPDRISQFHWVDLFSDDGYELLLKALKLRANTINIAIKPINKTNDTHKNIKQAKKTYQPKNIANNSEETNLQKASLLNRVKRVGIGAMNRVKRVGIGAIIGAIWGLIIGIITSVGDSEWIFEAIITEAITGALIGSIIIHNWKTILIYAVIVSIIWTIVDYELSGLSVDIETVVRRGLIIGSSIGGLLGAIIEKIKEKFVPKTK